MSGLEHLLTRLEQTQTWEPGAPDEHIGPTTDATVAFMQARPLLPDAVRLLIDMADAVALARGYIPSSEQFGALDINALLARYASLNQKAGTA